MQEALKGDSVDGIKSATDALQQELMAMGQAVYAQPGAQAGGAQPGADAGAGPQPGSGDSKPDDPNVVDAEFTDSSEK